MKAETAFRNDIVIPFIETLKNTVCFPIQQLAIRGTPDLFLCVYGRFIALELKSLFGVADPLQKYNCEQIRNKGKGKAFVVGPSNWESFQRILTRLDQGETIDD